MSAAEPKLACRGVWKLFGPDADRFAGEGQGFRSMQRMPRASFRR